MNDTPIQKFLEALERTNGEAARKGGNGWIARCPAHDDKNPSLSIGVGQDGRVLLKCHANCSSESICESMGCKMSDLFDGSNGQVANRNNNRADSCTSPHASTPSATLKSQAKDGKDKSSTGDRQPSQFAKTLMRLRSQMRAKETAAWRYHNENGETVSVVFRFDLPDGKQYRPISKIGGRWQLKGFPEPRPLYRLTEVSKSDLVYITEGEKAADATCSLELTATTSPHGSKSAGKADWSPLSGKNVVILPDNDEAGRCFAEAVVDALAKLSPHPVVKIVQLPDLPDGGDMADWVKSNSATPVEKLREQIEAMVAKQQPIKLELPKEEIERFRPFPTHTLPQPIADFVERGATAIKCDSSFLALPMLSALASAIGNSRQLRLKESWKVPAIIWTAIVGESGTSKTPAFKLVMKPVRERQRRLLRQHQEAMEQFEDDKHRHEKNLTAWKRRANDSEPPPKKPEPPVAERVVVSDTTVEALAPILLANPRGVLLARDELAGWFGSFDRYAKGGAGTDESNWLSMHNGESMTIDRKTGYPSTIYVPQAFVSITGGIQPTILHAALGIDHRESGLAARMLLTCPPRRAKKWTEDEITPEDEATIEQIFEHLYDLQAETNAEGDPVPVVVDLTSDAKEIWKEYYDSHAEEQADLTGELSAAWSKLEEYAARFALVFHFVRLVANDPHLKSPDFVDTESMAAGVELAEWFKRETRRVYSVLAESEAERKRRRLIEWIERKGKPVSAREAQQGCRWLESSLEAENALNDLVQKGVGRWETKPPGGKGQPTRRFVLSTVYGNNVKPQENSNTVDVDANEDFETTPDDNWGEV